jgi:hypothetical protein
MPIEKTNELSLKPPNEQGFVDFELRRLEPHF